MRKCKLNMTRPEFLLKFLTSTEDPLDVTVENMERIIPTGSKLIYAAYSCIMESDLHRTDITYINMDDESIVMKLSSKNIAKRIKEECNKEMIRFGDKVYKVHVKIDGTYVFVSIEPDHMIDDNFQ